MQLYFLQKVLTDRLCLVFVLSFLTGKLQLCVCV